MDAARWRRVRQIFDAALAKPPDERRDFVAEAVGSDDGLQEEVLSLLRSHDTSDGFLEDPAFDLKGPESPPMNSPADVRWAPAGIGPYRLVRILGQGGMGSVYLAERDDAEYSKRVALKILHQGLETEDLVRRFRSERQILASLEHPHIARLLDGGTTEDGRPYLVMDFVEGEPVDAYCDRRQLSIPERLRLFVAICGAVHFAHQNLVVHRDLKPGNILVTAEGEPRLLDFGIAKLLSPETFPQTLAHTEPGRAPMTPAYASPEQIRGATITTASDVYSLGVLLHELLTGHLPYRLKDTTPWEVRNAVVEGEPSRPSLRVDEAAAEHRRCDPRSLRRQLSGDLDTIVLKALHKEPSRRYLSAEELAEDLRRHLGGRPVRARPATLGYRVGRFLRRHRLPAAAAALALVVLVSFLITLLVQRRQILRQSARAEEVSSFLMELFDLADPDSTGGETLTPRQMLDRGARQIEGRMADQPDVQADLRETIGRVYNNVGAFDAALPHLEEALALRRASHGGAHPDVLRTLVLLGDVSQERGDHAAAEARYREAVELARSRRRDTPELAHSLSSLALLLQDTGRMEEAEPLHREAVALAEEVFEAPHERQVEILNRWAGFQRVRESFEEADAAYRRALGLERVLHGPVHSHIARQLNNLGLLLLEESRRRETGRFTAAEEHFREALALERQLYDGAHPAIATTLQNLAETLQDQAHFEEARELYREALAVRREIYGGEHARVASTLNNLGAVEHDLGDLDAAEAHYRQAIALWERLGWQEHPDLGSGYQNLGQLLLDRGDYGAARPLLEQSLAILQNALGPEHSRVAAVLNPLGRVLREQGDLEGARTRYREALTILRRRHGPRHLLVAQQLNSLAIVERRLGNLTGAEAHYREAGSILEELLGTEHPNYLQLQNNLGVVLIERGDFNTAEPLLRRILEAGRRALSPEHPLPWEIQAVLGSCLAARGEREAGKALILESLAQLEATQGPDAAATRRVEERLAGL